MFKESIDLEHQKRGAGRGAAICKAPLGRLVSQICKMPKEKYVLETAKRKTKFGLKQPKVCQ